MSKQNTPPAAPNAAQTYAQGIQTFLKYLPQLVSTEQQYRSTYDPQRIAAQQALQAKFGGSMYQQQLGALKQLDPAGTALRSLLGAKEQAYLKAGYTNPQQAQAYKDLAARVNQGLTVGALDPGQLASYQGLGNLTQEALARGGLDPSQIANYQALGSNIQTALAQGGLTPEQAAAYKQLGQRVQGDVGLGTQQDPEAIRQEQQFIRAGEAARGNAFGAAPISAEALYGGERGQQLYQQRLANEQGYLGLQNPAAQAQQMALQYGQLPTPESQAAQLGLQYSSLATPESQALGAGMNFYGQQTPQANALAQAGSFLASPTPEQQIGQIQGVTPDRSYGYVNPQAGYQGQQFGLANYANKFAGYNPTNPWSNALSGAASGASTGAMFGGGYGALIGGAGGAIQGYFSDRRLKTDICKVGTLDIYSYRYKPRCGPPGRFIGPMAEDIEKMIPGAVRRVGGLRMVNASIIPQIKEEE
jgi:hypothetical protein